MSFGYGFYSGGTGTGGGLILRTCPRAWRLWLAQRIKLAKWCLRSAAPRPSQRTSQRTSLPCSCKPLLPRSRKTTLPGSVGINASGSFQAIFDRCDITRSQKCVRIDKSPKPSENVLDNVESGQKDLALSLTRTECRYCLLSIRLMRAYFAVCCAATV